MGLGLGEWVGWMVGLGLEGWVLSFLLFFYYVCFIGFCPMWGLEGSKKSWFLTVFHPVAPVEVLLFYCKLFVVSLSSQVGLCFAYDGSWELSLSLPGSPATFWHIRGLVGAFLPGFSLWKRSQGALGAESADDLLVLGGTGLGLLHSGASGAAPKKKIWSI